MKTTVRLAALLLIIVAQGCKQGDTAPKYQTATQAKYKALGWTQTPDGSDQYTQTKGQKGWVLY